MIQVIICCLGFVVRRSLNTMSSLEVTHLTIYGFIKKNTDILTSYNDELMTDLHKLWHCLILNKPTFPF